MAIVRNGRSDRRAGFESFLLDQVQAAVIATDAIGLITHWNRHAERLLGWATEEAMGRQILELVVSRERTEEAAEIMDRLRAGETWEGEFSIIRKDGSSILCHLTDSPILDEEGRTAGMVAIAVDVTERKRHEALIAARTSVTHVLAEAGSLAEAAPRVIEGICQNLGWDLGTLWAVDDEAGVLQCIRVWHRPNIDGSVFETDSRRLRFSRGVGLPGRVWADSKAHWIPDVMNDGNFPRSAAAAQTGLHGAFGFPILLGGAVLGVLEFFSRDIHQPDEELLQALGIIGSQLGQFMERKEAEAAVRESEARKTAVLLSALDAVITMDGDGNVVEFNPAAERIFGRKSDEMVGQEMAELIIPPSLRDRHRMGLRRYRETGEGPLLGHRTEFTGMRADGTEFPVELTITRVDLPGPPLFTGYVRDITDRKAVEDELRKSRDQLQAIFEGVSEGISVQDTGGKLLYANDAAARLSGFASAQAMLKAPRDEVFRRFHIMDEAGQPLPLDELPGRKALQGHASERTVRYRDVRTGEERWSAVRATPVFDPSGGVQFAISIFHDVTEQKRVEEAQRFLAEASELLSRSLDYEETLAQVAHLAVLSLADWCSVDMLQEDGSIRQLAVEHLDPSKVEMAKWFRERYPSDPNAQTGVTNVIRTGSGELIAEITDEMLVQAAPDEEFLRTLRDLGLRSVITAPLSAAGRTLGAITFVSAESGRRYTEQDLAYAQQLADRAALAVNNARLFKQRDDIARVLQRSLVPPDIPDIPGMDLASVYRAAGEAYEVGGDFYDVFETGDGGWAIVIGDVCGKGPEAAAITGVARHAIRTAAMKERRPSEVLTMLNDALRQGQSNHTFCTVSYARIGPSGKKTRLTVCNAGHPLPLVLRADGSVEAAGMPGTLLGVFADPELKDRVVELRPGDALVLYTDGVTEELTDASAPGRDHLARILGGLRGGDAVTIASSLRAAVEEAKPSQPRDDIAIVVARLRP